MGHLPPLLGLVEASAQPTFGAAQSSLLRLWVYRDHLAPTGWTRAEGILGQPLVGHDAVPLRGDPQNGQKRMLIIDVPPS